MYVTLLQWHVHKNEYGFVKPVKILGFKISGCFTLFTIYSLGNIFISVIMNVSKY